MTALDAQTRPAHDQTVARPRLTLFVMCLTTFMIQVDVTIVNVALPRLQAGLDLGTNALLWVVTAYALSLASFIPVAGALGDRFGHKPVFITGVSVFVAGSAGCAVAPSGLVLVLARAVQGAGGAAMLALTLSIVAEAFPREVRPRVIGTWAAVGGTGFGVGPVAGGLILSVAAWPAVFWVNVPVGLLTVLLARVALPRPRRGVHPLDRTGAVLCAAGLFCLTYGLTRSSTHAWTSPGVAEPGILGLLLLAGFVAWERTAAHPMAPSALMRVPGFAAASLVYLGSYVAFSGILFFSTLLYQDVAGWSVLHTGLSWLFMNAPFLVLAQSGGRLQGWFRARTLVAGGCLLAAGGAALLASVDTTTPFAVTAAGFVLSGAGFGAFMPPLAHVAMAEVPARFSGVASGLFNTARQAGTSVGLAVLGYAGAKATLSTWHEHAAHLRLGTAVTAHATTQLTAHAGLAQEVVTGRVAAVGRALGPAYRQAAVASFEHGYHWAVGLGAAFLTVSAIVAWAAFPDRVRPHSESRTRPVGDGGRA